MQTDETARVFHRCGDVFEFQRRGIGRQHRARLDLGFQIREQLLLHVQPFDDRLDDDVGAGDPFSLRVGDQTLLGGGLQRFGFELAAEQFALPGDALGKLLGIDVLQRHFHAGGHANAGDVGAHRARTNHVNPHRLPRQALRRLPLQKFSQAEHAAQIARGIGHQQRCERRRLRRLHRIEIAAVLLEQIDQGKWCRIVVAACLLGGFLAHFLSQQAARRPLGHKHLHGASGRRFAVL